MSDSLSTPRGRVLFIDDDADVLASAELVLKRRGFAFASARNPREAYAVLSSEPIDVVLLDLNFQKGAISGEEGFNCLRNILAHDPDATVVVVTGHSGVNIAVAAMRAGASDFVMKPWNNERLIATISAAFDNRHARLAGPAPPSLDGTPGPVLEQEGWGEEALILGESPAIERARDLIRRAAPSDASVLIFGEAGSGKGLMARHLHRLSRRRGAYIAVDLSGLGGDEAETALFGAPGRESGRPGAIQSAQGGTLFLDEVGAMSPRVQGRLLEVLEERQIMFPDAAAPMRPDLRIVSASRRPRDELQAQRAIRQDLLYRLNTIEIFAPPLRARGGDAVLLAEHFLHLFSVRHKRPLKALSEEARAAIEQDPWPGDVRAQRQAMERCVVLSEGPRHEVSDIPLTAGARAQASAGPEDLNLSRSERSLVQAALTRHSFNVSHAAKELGLTRAALYRRMAKHGL